MKWNWRQPRWPEFTWNPALLAKSEAQFLLEAGTYTGTVKHLGAPEREQLTVDAMSTEAVTTSEIEGEILDRDSVQSSIRRQLGFAADQRKVGPAELGTSELMVDCVRSPLRGR
jgi:Fic family protein